MSYSEILDSNSPEVKELFSIIEKAKENINNHTVQKKPMFFDEVYLDNNEVCQLLHLSSRTLQDYRDKGLVAFYKLEGKILYKMSDIQNLLEKNYYDVWLNYK